MQSWHTNTLAKQISIQAPWTADDEMVIINRFSTEISGKTNRKLVRWRKWRWSRSFSISRYNSPHSFSENAHVFHGVILQELQLLFGAPYQVFHPQNVRLLDHGGVFTKFSSHVFFRARFVFAASHKLFVNGQNVFLQFRVPRHDFFFYRAQPFSLSVINRLQGI